MVVVVVEGSMSWRVGGEGGGYGGGGWGERGLIKMMQIQWGGLWWTVSGVNCRMCLIKMISETSERCV